MVCCLFSICVIHINHNIELFTYLTHIKANMYLTHLKGNGDFIANYFYSEEILTQIVNLVILKREKL